MITTGDLISTILALIFLFVLAFLMVFVYKKSQELLYKESKARIEMYNAISDLCESWVESDES